MEDFITMNSSRYPELVNFMGFAQQIDLEDEKMLDLSKSEAIYEDHLSFDEMVIGIREGRFFKGRLNISRDNPNEATVNVDGLTNDLLILGMKNQNRGLSGDQVCLQILPEKDWPLHYREA
jgi:exoribonuclease R